MQNSKLPYLTNIDRVVLCAGHGFPPDPGALGNGAREYDNNLYIRDKIAQILRDKGIRVDIVPTEVGLHQRNGNWVLQKHIEWINANYFAFNANRSDNSWVIEIHRDYAANLPEPGRSSRHGIYYFQNDQGSKQIAEFLLNSVKKNGASDNSWIRGHYVTQGGNTFPLGWIEKTTPIAHLIEHAHMDGDNSNANLDRLATRSAIAIYEAMTGEQFIQPQSLVSANEKPTAIENPQKIDSANVTVVAETTNNIQELDENLQSEPLSNIDPIELSNNESKPPIFNYNELQKQIGQTVSIYDEFESAFSEINKQKGFVPRGMAILALLGTLKNQFLPYFGSLMTTFGLYNQKTQSLVSATDGYIAIAIGVGMFILAIYLEIDKTKYNQKKDEK